MIRTFFISFHYIVNVWGGSHREVRPVVDGWGEMVVCYDFANMDCHGLCYVPAMGYVFVTGYDVAMGYVFATGYDPAT